MKFFAFIFLAVIAGATALPQNAAIAAREERIVTGVIVSAIEAVAQGIRDAGADPFYVESAQIDYVFGSNVEASAFLNNLEFVGLSNIAINTMDFSVLLNRLRFNISLPEIKLSIGSSGVSVSVFGHTRGTYLSGSIAVRQPRIAGEVRVNVGVISGISVRDLSINLSLGGIESALNLNVNDRDLSSYVNTFFNVIVVDFLANNKDNINQTIENIIWEIIDRIL